LSQALKESLKEWQEAQDLLWNHWVDTGLFDPLPFQMADFCDRLVPGKVYRVKDLGGPPFQVVTS